MTQVIAVSAGLPQEGATTFSTALALELARRNYKVCLLDADWSGANTGAALCLRPEWNLLDLACNRAGIDQVVDRRRPGIDYLSGGGANRSFSQLDPEQLQRLAQRLSRLPEYDYLVIDAAAGTEKKRLALLEAADTLVAVGTPGEGLLNETYDLVRRLHQHGCTERLSLVMNCCRNHTVGRHAYGRLREVVDFYLSFRLPLLGILRNVERAPAHAVSNVQPLFEAGSLVEDIARCADLLCSGRHGQARGSLPDFWIRFLKAADIPQVAITVADVPPSESDSQAVDAPPTESDSQAADAPVPEQNMRDQLDTLSSHIESLIDQLERYAERLPSEAEAGVESVPAFDDQPQTAVDSGPVLDDQPPPGADYWLALVEHEFESRDEAGCETYRILQPSGRQVRCVYFRPSG